MKPWTDLSLIPMPPRVAALPKDPRGYPIPASAMMTVKGPDFRVIDQHKAHRLFTTARCGICGEPLGRFRALVGGAMSMQHGMFTDIPMHVDCAEYAMKVCPFLAAPKFFYSQAEKDKAGGDTIVSETMSTERPKVFGLGITRDPPRYVRNGPDVVIKVRSWESVSWWRQGEKIDVQTEKRDEQSS